MRKTAKCKRCAVAKVPFSSSFFLSFFSLATMFNNNISKKVQVLTVILSQNWFLSQRGALRPLSVFIATNSPWSIKLFLALPSCCPLCRTPFSNVLYACAEVVSFPNQRPQSLVWERDWCTREIVASSLVPRLLRSGTRTLKLCRCGEPGIFVTWKAQKIERR